MNHLQFYYWLTGFVGGMGGATPTDVQWAEILRNLLMTSPTEQTVAHGPTVIPTPAHQPWHVYPYSPGVTPLPGTTFEVGDYPFPPPVTSAAPESSPWRRGGTSSASMIDLHEGGAE